VPAVEVEGCVVASRRIEVEIIGDAASLERALSRSSGAVNRFGKTASSTARHTDRMSRATHAFKIAGLASIPVIGLLAYQLHSAVQEAADVATATNRLKDAVKGSGQQWKKYSGELVDATHRQSVMGAFTLPETTDSMAKMELATGNTSKAIHLNSLAMDIARGRNISLQSSSLLVSKAYQGNTTSLKRLGIALPEIGKKMSKVEARQKILNYLSKKFGGDAKAYGNTAQGSLDKLNVAFEDLKGTIGSALLPVIKNLAGRFSKWLGQKKNVELLTSKARDFGKALNSQVIPALKTIVGLLKTMASLANSIVMPSSTYSGQLQKTLKPGQFGVPAPT
jgi:hypothetical protein